MPMNTGPKAIITSVTTLATSHTPNITAMQPRETNQYPTTGMQSASPFRLYQGITEKTLAPTANALVARVSKVPAVMVDSPPPNELAIAPLIPLTTPCAKPDT